jgi:hypothetical protein
MRKMCGFDRARGSAQRAAILAVSSGAAVIAYGTVAFHADVSPDSKSSANSPQPSNM